MSSGSPPSTQSSRSCSSYLPPPFAFTITPSLRVVVAACQTVRPNSERLVLGAATHILRTIADVLRVPLILVDQLRHEASCDLSEVVVAEVLTTTARPHLRSCELLDLLERRLLDHALLTHAFTGAVLPLERKPRSLPGVVTRDRIFLVDHIPVFVSHRLLPAA